MFFENKIDLDMFTCCKRNSYRGIELMEQSWKGEKMGGLDIKGIDEQNHVIVKQRALFSYIFK